jgi:hypothetical protein
MDQPEPRTLEIVVIDDSVVIREQLSRAFAEAEGLHLVGLAATPMKASKWHAHFGRT